MPDLVKSSRALWGLLFEHRERVDLRSPSHRHAAVLRRLHPGAARRL